MISALILTFLDEFFIFQTFGANHIGHMGDRGTGSATEVEHAGARLNGHVADT